MLWPLDCQLDQKVLWFTWGTYSYCVNPFFHRFFHPSTLPSIYSSTNPSIHQAYSLPSIFTSVHLYISPSFRESFRLSIFPFINPSFRQSFLPFVNPSFLPSILPSFRQPFLPSVNPSFRQSFLPSFRQSFLPPLARPLIISSMHLFIPYFEESFFDISFFFLFQWFDWCWSQSVSLVHAQC